MQGKVIFFIFYFMKDKAILNILFGRQAFLYLVGGKQIKINPLFFAGGRVGFRPKR